MNNTDSQQQKNGFVIALRDYLMANYKTETHHTFGEERLKGEERDGVYFGVHRDPAEPRDITGFCLRKDLCGYAPDRAEQVLKLINCFAISCGGLEAKLENEADELTLRFGSDRYIVSAHIGEGYADKIDVSFTKMPVLKIPAERAS